MPKIETAKSKAASTKPVAAKPRMRRLNRKYKKQIIKTTKKLPSSFRLLSHAFRHIWHHKKLFAGILFIFALLYVVLVKGLATEFQLAETSDAIDDVADNVDPVAKSFALLGALLGTSGQTTGEAAGVYQVVLLLIISLALIWTLRQTFDDKVKVRIRDAYYKSLTPFIPYILVWLVILLQCIPALITSSLFGIASANGLVNSGFEQFLMILILTLGIGITVYFVSASIFATYIVTLPNMTPLLALKTARKLVRFRRWAIIRKAIFLPFALLVLFALIFLPLVLFLPVIAEVLFVLLGIVLILIVHSYFYVLYRELL